MTKKKQEMQVIHKCITLDEAEKIVYDELLAGTNYRVITQMEFQINDKTKRFNISQISQIKRKNEPKSETNHKDSELALVFKLFKQGLNPVDVIIKTELSHEFVQKAHQQYLEFINSEVILKSVLENLFADARRYGPCEHLGQLQERFAEAVDDAIKYHTE